ncbi:hypothetical protein [Modicisalibacter coralii]|uniref:hypothetical protein n=1 Tax=Modicisalibacter coralii TaxID=2304602 RepID=UPI00100A2766|nr:hypothetical protein [Halomonas coralii]
MSTPKQVSVTISRPQGGARDEEVIVVSIDDESSRLPIVEFEMPLADFMRCLTGLGAVKAPVNRFTHEDDRSKLGMKVIRERVECRRAKSLSGKDEQREIVMEHIATLPAEYRLFSDGTQSQQHGDSHVYTVEKYVEE